jgi:hypothetical protein
MNLVFLLFPFPPSVSFLTLNPALVFNVELRIIRQQNLLLTVLYTWQAFLFIK